jgi:hypothetical protein
MLSACLMRNDSGLYGLPKSETQEHVYTEHFDNIFVLMKMYNKTVDKHWDQ